MRYLEQRGLASTRGSARSRDRGAALVITLIVCTVLAVVVVAMMQNTTLDRASSAGIANQYRARLAAEAGLAVASAALATNSTNDTFIVMANTNRQLFVGNGVSNPPSSTSFAYMPLFSTVTGLTSPVAAITSAVVPTTNVAGGLVFTNQLPGGLSAISPQVTWIYMTNMNGTTNARFAYWVEDLGGRLDMSVVGTNTAGRPTGTNPAEIALWSIFSPGQANDFGNAIAGALIGARSNLLTAATARLVNAGVKTNDLADLTTKLRHDVNEPEVIPFGFGYADQGKPKYNLNTNTNAAALAGLVAAIQANLPGFATANRSGGMSGVRYVNAIAASMIDYVDTNNVPTAGTAGGGAFRGIEGLPFVTETATAIHWVNHGTNIVGFGGKIADEIHVENYVELWNPTDKSFSGVIDVTFSNDYACGIVNFTAIDLRITNTTANSSFTNTSGFVAPNYQINVVPPLEPNEYRAFSLGTNIYRFVVSANPTQEPRYNGKTVYEDGFLDVGLPLSGTTDSFGSMLSLRYGGVDYDRVAAILRQTRTIRCRPFATRAADKLPDWAGNVPALRMTPRESMPLPGDPRMGFYLSTTNDAQGYTSTAAKPGSSMGFRNNALSSGNTPYNTEPNRWLDAGFANTPLRSAQITESNRPPTIRQTNWINHTNDFVQKLNNTGTWTNILELGHVFDPMAWNIPTNTPNILSTHAAAGNGTTAVTYGGGNTLRIGRAEHPRFTNDGLRASQLLDLFAVGPTVGSTVVNRVPGRININTASTNVLRALAAGVRHTNETSLLPTTNLVVPVAAVTAFVSGVTNFRANRPFFSVSQLNLISTNTNAPTWASGTVFGRTNLLGATAWGDRSAEEWFSRVYPFATVRSRNFLVHVIGQSLATNNPTVPLSTAKRAFQIYVEPLRGANGLTTNSLVRILGTWDL